LLFIPAPLERRRVGGMRRFVLLACGVSVALLLAGGLAMAATVRCDQANSDDPCFGTGGDDDIHGTAERNYVFARAGSDVIHLGGGEGDWAAGDQKGPRSYRFSTRQGNDTIYGGSSRDFIYGDGGDDTLYGGPDDDSMHGDSLVSNRGDDTLRGGSGDDWLKGGSGEDRLYGGEGDDHFAEGQDGAEDHLYCGEGYDTYYPLDASDHVATDCEEQVPIPPPPPPEP
jgi:Ca2+-binding RTX toxin-like protein